MQHTKTLKVHLTARARMGQIPGSTGANGFPTLVAWAGMAFSRVGGVWLQMCMRA